MADYGITKNNAQTTITAALTTTGTSITVADATKLAQPGTGQFAYATLRRALTGEKEVIKYTSASGTTVSGVTRDVESTPDSDGDGTGLTFVSGDFIENRIPKGYLDTFIQRTGDNGQGNNDVTGDLYWSNTAGPVIMNEAATTTNPTLIPNQAELDTGWGWASDVLVAVLGGAEAWRLSTTQVLASNAAGPSLQNEAASTTNPTLIPNQAEVDTGWGWASDVLVAVLGGAEKWRLSGTQVLSADAAGPSLQNEAATTTNPTLIPNQAEVDTGWGWASDELHAVLGGTDTASFEATQLALPVAAYAIDHEGATSFTLRTDSDLLVISVDNDGGGTGIIDFAASGVDQFHIDAGQLYSENSAGPTIQNEAATTTNPTLVPNRAEEDTGWGWASDALQAIGGGANLGQWSAAGIEVANAAGGIVLNEASSGTNPTLAPNKADLDTGVGTEGTDVLDLVAGGVNAMKFTEATGVIVDHQLTAGLTASTTQTQGQGALVSTYNEVATVANANDTVTLPTAVVGRRCVVINNGANTLQIFPASGDNLGAGVDTAETIASGTSKEYIAYDATNWDVPNSQAGTPGNDSIDKEQLVAGYANGWVWIESSSASNSPTIDFDLPAGFAAYKCIFSGVIPATDDEALQLRVSDDDGVSFEAGASDYAWTYSGIVNDTTSASAGDAADDAIMLVTDLAGAGTMVGNAADEGCSGQFYLHNAASSALHPQAIYQVNWRDQTGQNAYMTGGGNYTAVTSGGTLTVDAIRLMFRSGNITSGTFHLFGLRTDQT
jgi:hypothetical protein